MNQEDKDQLEKKLRDWLGVFQYESSRGGRGWLMEHYVDAIVKHLLPLVAGECDTEYGKGWNDHLDVCMEDGEHDD